MLCDYCFCLIKWQTREYRSSMCLWFIYFFCYLCYLGSQREFNVDWRIICAILVSDCFAPIWVLWFTNEHKVDLLEILSALLFSSVYVPRTTTILCQAYNDLSNVMLIINRCCPFSFILFANAFYSSFVVFGQYWTWHEPPCCCSLQILSSM